MQLLIRNTFYASKKFVLTFFYIEPVIRMSLDDITVVPNFSQIKYISVLPIGPFFEIHVGSNLIWEKFGITVMSSGLILITGIKM